MCCSISAISSTHNTQVGQLISACYSSSRESDASGSCRHLYSFTQPPPIHIIKNKTLKQNKASWWGGSVDKKNLGDRSRRQPGLHGEFRIKQTTTEHRQTSVCPTSDVSCSEDWACRKPHWDSSLFLSQSRTGQGWAGGPAGRRAGGPAGRRAGQTQPFFILISLAASSGDLLLGFSDLWIACAWLHIFSYWSTSLFDSSKLLI